MSTDSLTPVRPAARTYTLDDMHVRSDGSGRVVEAYAAVFNVETEVMDQDGHYREKLSPVAFNRTLQHKGPTGFGVLFNHGRTIDGTPAGELTMPIGVPLEVRADERGVYTVTRYLENPLADNVLEAIKAGAIKAQSFSGRFMRSVRSFPNGRGRGALPLITRNEVDMREYGPAVFAAYTDAAILGTRSTALFARALLALPEDQRVEFLQQFEGVSATPGDLDTAAPSGTPTGTAGQTDDAREHSARSDKPNPLRDRIRAERARRGM